MAEGYRVQDIGQETDCHPDSNLFASKLHYRLICHVFVVVCYFSFTPGFCPPITSLPSRVVFPSNDGSMHLCMFSALDLKCVS